MTLPFRRRHHDDETAHDRARALTSSEMIESLGGEDAAWLTGHLEACAECRQEREAFLADRALLRGLRERTPEPPRDLWARTSAALEREARGHRGRRPVPARGRGLPFGAAAGVLIVIVVIGAGSIRPIPLPNESPGGSQAAVNSLEPQPTTFEITAGRISYIRSAANGSWEFVQADVDAVCPRTRPSCEQLIEDDPGRPVTLAGTPIGVTVSPDDNQLVVEARGAGTSPDRIYVVPVPPATPAVSPAPTDGPAVPSGEPATPSPATPSPATPSPASPEPSVVVPEGIVEIASGVMIVGEAAYSADGMWLAFSARPSDGSAGPDLYLWTRGDATATAVTTDHRTYFSTWLGDRVLASRVDDPGNLDPSAPTSAPDADATGAPATVEAHPASFLLDPTTLTRTDLAHPDLWLPVVDPTGRFVAYWSGTLVPTADGLDWQLATGRLVLDGWSAGPSAEPTPEPDALALGPIGAPVAVVAGPTAVFMSKFDPTGTRLAVWVGEQPDADVGRLHLFVLDSESGAIEAGPERLPGAPALRRFSIAEGRLAWVTPSGQDGQDSSVQVLGWSNSLFGEIRTIPAKALYLVR
ncbi:MAG: hypothetical protein ABIZ52_04375 [Candidatus Limnocylindrales bacterium]